MSANDDDPPDNDERPSPPRDDASAGEKDPSSPDPDGSLHGRRRRPEEGLPLQRLSMTWNGEIAKTPSRQKRRVEKPFLFGVLASWRSIYRVPRQ